MTKFFKKWWLLILIVLISIFLRAWRLQAGFAYNHDNDLAGWIIKDIVENRHLRLIGQLTSTPGIFIGPLFYYYELIFYLLFKMDPIGGAFAVLTLGGLSTVSFWFVFTKVFGKNEGYLAGYIHAFSYYLILNDREAVPTMPVILWTVWFFYTISLLLKGKKEGFIILAFLVGLIWHLNMALILAVPTAVLAIILSGKKLSPDVLKKGAALFGLVSLPLILFELRHNFNQVRAIILAFSVPQNDIVSGFAKFERVLLLLGKNVNTYLFGSTTPVSYPLVLAGSIAVFLYLFHKKKITKNHFITLTLWGVSYVVFFSFYSKILSEYYLNGALFIWMLLLVILVSSLISSRYKLFGYAILIVYTIVNLHSLFTLQFNRNGYLERKQLVEAIDQDRLAHNYPCVSISYITSPGYDLGYRYFFWLRKMHVNRPDSGAPPYTIVFPLKDIFVTDKTYGAIGLIYPDYSRYTKDSIAKSCSGQNSNLTDSMFGYTE